MGVDGRLTGTTTIWIFMVLLTTGVKSQDVDVPATCADLQCQNEAPCSETSEGPRCQCTPGFLGTLCDVIDHCENPTTHLCANNALCVNGERNYTCQCLSGWEGTLCSQEKNECDPDPCQNNGQCADLFDTFSCVCPANLTGQTCTEDVDECQQNSTLCQNEATCQNEFGGFQCTCQPGYRGVLCEEEIDECDSSPCLFGGLCEDLINNFRCECLDGFEGPRCQAVVKQCQLSDLCGDNGLCVERPLGGYQCFCQPGYYGDNCEAQVDLCGSQPCRHGAPCTNFGTSYQCDCPAGYTGQNCQNDVDECAGNPCANNGTCSQPAPGDFECTCTLGFTGHTCEDDVDECAALPCENFETCINLVNAYRCECPPGKSGDWCDVDVFDCRVTPCENGGACDSDGGTHTCSCVSPFTGHSCDSSLDPCVPNPCIHGGECKTDSENGGFTCECLDGFLGDRCEADIYDCHSQPCLNGGTCMDTAYMEGGDGRRFTCQCSENFTGYLCDTAVHVCMSHECINGATCLPNEDDTAYTCQCTTGWTGSRCEENINECLADLPPCLNNGQCLDQNPGFRCICLPPWTGAICNEYIPQCTADSCKNGGQCEERPATNSFECLCTDEFTGDDCSDPVDPCRSNPCKNDATCQKSEAGNSDFKCECLPGYTGRLCDGNIDECTIQQPCGDNGVCRDGINSFTCECRIGWTGERCDTMLDQCPENFCENGGTCYKTTDFECDCPLGYRGKRCETDVNDCYFEPCLNNATCVDLVHGVRCDCLEGFTGVGCDYNIDDCALSPCASTGTCVDLVNDYRCDCNPGYTGRACEEDIPECASVPCAYGGTCSEPSPGVYDCACPSGVDGKDCDAVATASFIGSSGLTLPPIASLVTEGPQADVTPSPARKRRSLPSHYEISVRERRLRMKLDSAAEDDANDFECLHQSGNVWTETKTKRVKRQAGSGDPVIERQASLVSQISFTFTTTQPMGILLLATGTSITGQPQHILLYIQSNSLHLSASNGEQVLQDSIALTPQGSGIYSHAVALNFQDNASVLTLDPPCNSEETDCASVSLGFQNSTSWILDDMFHFGGVGELTAYARSILIVTEGFVGCLGNLVINDKSVNLAEAAEFFDKVSASEGPLAGCESHVPCLEGYCSNGGTCHDLWTSRSCACLPGFTGDRCEAQNMAHFEPQSFMYYPFPRNIAEISFWFTSLNGTGLLVYTIGEIAMSLSIDGNQVRMQLIFTATGRDLVSKVGSNLQLQNWVKVLLRFSDYRYHFEVSTETGETFGPVTGTASNVLLVPGPLFFGALHPHSALDVWRLAEDPLSSTQGLKGCIRDLRINALDIDLMDAALSPFGNDPPLPVPGCGREESCQKDPCLNDGVCVAGWDTPTCQCGASFSGDNCSEASSHTFNGESSYSFLQLDRTLVGFGDTGGIEFKTRQDVSTLLLIQLLDVNGGPKDLIEFRIFSGFLQIYSSFSGATVQSEDRVTDGQWHSLSWRPDREFWFITLDSKTFYLRASFNPFDPTFNPVVHIYVGAKPVIPGTNTTIVGFFKGCIRNVTFNSQVISYAISRSGISVTPISLVSGCQKDQVCSPNPCPPNSFCQDTWNAYTCVCLPGWEGENCDQDVDDCEENVCQNGAACRDQHLSYVCECPPTFTGRLCETVYHPCDDNPCNADGTESCLLYNSTSFACRCKPGFTGTLCDAAVDFCASVPCANGGRCSNRVETFHCECVGDYIGERCQIFDHCRSDPCFNGGACSLPVNHVNEGSNIDSSSPSSSSSSSAVVSSETASGDSSLLFLCNCSESYFGSQCQYFNHCRENSCQNNAPCLQENDEFSCNCSDQFYGTFCQYENFCYNDPCLNGGECRNSQDSYRCLCPFYFSGTNCENPINQCEFNVCFNGAVCVFDPEAATTPPVNNTAKCICLEGFEGDNCEIDINECLVNPCMNNGTCIESSSSPQSFFPGFRCLCVPGFAGDTCDEDINDCEGLPCKNGGNCKDLVNAYRCDCASGFSGTNCSVDERGCGSDPCMNGALCSGEGDNFTCTCLEGFTGDACEINVDDCVSHTCLNGASCKDGVNSYTCDCLAGYDGDSCENVIDSCYSQPCFYGGNCTYRGLCSCLDVVITCGWHDDCQRQRCDERSDCETFPQSYICHCPESYTGTQCAQNVDECQLNPSPCQNGGRCVDTEGSFECVCDGTGYQGTLCQEDEDECAIQKPCFNGGNCTNTPGSYECQCPPAWTGNQCGENKDDCEVNPCQNGGNCLDLLGDYLCDCTRTGFTGKNCTENVDDCINNRCQHQAKCLDGVRRYTCQCNETTGYTGDFCEIEPVSCSPNFCLNNGSCSFLESGAVSCDCEGTGYHGDVCQLDVNECADNSHRCLSGSTCLNEVGAYRCQCASGYTGLHCDQALRDEDDSSSGASTGTIVAILLIIILVVVVLAIIAATWHIKKKRKTQGTYMPSAAEGVATPNIPMDKLADRGERLI